MNLITIKKTNIVLLLTLFCLMTLGCSSAKLEKVHVVKPTRTAITCDIDIVNNPKSTNEDLQNCLITYILMYNKD